MYAFSGMDYESAMKVPVPYRKWLLRRWNEQKQKENKQNGSQDVNEPLSQSEKTKAINQSKGINPNFPASTMLSK